MKEILGYVVNPNCPECYGLAGKDRLVMKAIRWGADFPGDKVGRRQGFTYAQFHCRRCVLYSPQDIVVECEACGAFYRESAVYVSQDEVFYSGEGAFYGSGVDYCNKCDSGQLLLTRDGVRL